MKELTQIQATLKAPKGQYNSFGKYKYRALEDITEALKPLLDKHSCSLLLNDEIVMIGDRYYVKATATLVNEKGTEAAVTAYARESLDKKGMDVAQITGAASSYARKYALNGLFAIDDTKDADATNNHDVPRGTLSGTGEDRSKWIADTFKKYGITTKEGAAKIYGQIDIVGKTNKEIEDAIKEATSG